MSTQSVSVALVVHNSSCSSPALLLVVSLTHNGVHLHGQLVNLGVVKRLNLAQLRLVLIAHEVDGHSLSAIPPTAPDTVDVVLPAHGQVVVDHQRHRVHVNAPR